MHECWGEQENIWGKKKRTCKGHDGWDKHQDKFSGFPDTAESSRSKITERCNHHNWSYQHWAELSCSAWFLLAKMSQCILKVASSRLIICISGSVKTSFNLLLSSVPPKSRALNTNHGNIEKCMIQEWGLRLRHHDTNGQANYYNTDQISMRKGHLAWEGGGWKGEVNILIKSNTLLLISPCQTYLVEYL